jgi:DNA polymerase-3 subunit gamma/tau
MAKRKADDGPEDSRDKSGRPSEYTVVARRYRPQQFAELIGQEHVAQALTNALTSGRVAHAYLFTGARGVGKTSAARILAKALNCVTGPTPTPCDVCDICRSIAAGDDVDVLEIDGASNNKVDEIRDLRSNVGFRPTRARYKIYIIDEVHMLSTSAFNALLKTLEEPPPHVKFIFATTEVQKIPITILSRCQRFDFTHVGTEKIFAQLRHVVGKEGLQADDDALRVIARRANGSMRDSQSLLDQLLAFADGRLTAERVHVLLGTAGDERVAALADAILAGDAKRGLELVTEAADRGLQLGELLDQLVDYWRGLMLVLSAGPEYRDLPGSPAFREKVRGHAAGRNLDTVLAGLDVLTTAKAKMRGSPHVQILLEMAVVRLSRLDDLLSVGQLADALARGEPAAAGNANRGPQPPVQSPAAEAAEPAKKKPLTAPEPGRNGTHPAAATPDPTDVSAVWARLLDEVGPIRAANLRQASETAIIGPTSLAIRFARGYSSAYEACASENGLEVLRLALKRATGRDWTVRVDLINGLAPPAAVPAPTATPARTTKDVLQLPMMRTAAEVLGAQLVKVDDGFDPAAIGSDEG